MAKSPAPQKTIVVIAEPGAAHYGTPGIASAAADGGFLSAAVADAGAELRPLIAEADARLLASVREGGASAPADPILERIYEIDLPADEAEATAARLAALPDVAGAYVQPDPIPAATIEATLDHALDGPEPETVPLDVNTAAPSAEPAPPATPNFVPRQIYRNAAPAGIDVAAAWARPGGRGAGIRVIDCEGAWRFTHEDLLQNQGGVIGPQTSDLGWRNHGTAVVSVIGGDDNGFGVVGIAPDAMVRGSSIFGSGGLASALISAANALQAGDIILIEVQYGHPVRGYTSVEWWPAEHAAIRYAVNKGVIVVEAAGNGGNNLDDPIYDQPLAGFPATWKNPFRRGTADSGAVLVGAGAPPPGTHGRDHGPDRSRLAFSNYGSPIDVQAWGREVTSAGYGDLQGGGNEDLWYSDVFSGTSSASPIVVGALACVQGALKAAGRPLLTPATARTTLRTTGSPQQDAPGRPTSQRIGNRPNLRQMIDKLLPSTVRPTAHYRYWNAPATDHFYTTNWSELGGGAHGWKYEGVQCYILPSQVPGTVPLYRYWNAGIADHFYTTNWSELGGGAHGWVYEGIQGYVRPSPRPGTVPLLRYWGNTDHFYTTNFAELGFGKNGYRFEGIQCWVYLSPAVPPEEDPDAIGVAAEAPAEGGLAPSDFALKGGGVPDAAMAAAGEGVSSIPFSEKAGGGAPAAPPEDGEGPRTDWASLGATGAGTVDAGDGRGVTININL